MNLTINTDASFCHQTKAGGWAFWVVCDAFKVKRSGQMKTLTKGSTEAEIKAIANALNMLLRFDSLPQIYQITINTDSMGAMRGIEAPKSDIDKYTSDLLNKLKDRTKAVKVEIRHVKGHSGINNPRSKVNQWCDTNAKARMIEHRALVNKQSKIK